MAPVGATDDGTLHPADLAPGAAADGSAAWAGGATDTTVLALASTLAPAPRMGNPSTTASMLPGRDPDCGALPPRRKAPPPPLPSETLGPDASLGGQAPRAGAPDEAFI